MTNKEPFSAKKFNMFKKMPLFTLSVFIYTALKLNISLKKVSCQILKQPFDNHQTYYFLI